MQIRMNKFFSLKNPYLHYLKSTFHNNKFSLMFLNGFCCMHYYDAVGRGVARDFSRKGFSNFFVWAENFSRGLGFFLKKP